MTLQANHLANAPNVHEARSALGKRRGQVTERTIVNADAASARAGIAASPMSFISCPPFDDSLSVSTIQKSNSTLASFPPVHVTRLVEPEHSIVYDCPVTELWTLIDLLPLVGIAIPVA